MKCIIKKEDRNKGAALASVIIAMTVVSVLVVAIIFAAYTNFNMKVVDKKSTDNFYTAESVLDQISGGLINEMSTGYTRAYTEVMSSYGNYTTIADLQHAFRTAYVLNLVEELQIQNGELDDHNNPMLEDSTHYSLRNLRSYVDASAYPSTATYTVGIDTAATGGNMIETLADGLVLRNILVTFTNGGYTDSISTDIKITIPGMVFSLISSMPDIADFAYVAEDGVYLSANTTLTLNGDAYSGNYTETDLYGEDQYRSITLQPGAKFNALNSELLVANGNVSAIGAAEFKTGSGASGSKATAFYAKNIDAGLSLSNADTAANKINIGGRSYIADDITLNGPDNELTIGGQYYGFGLGKGNTAADSSSIIINGKNSTIDMSGLNTLVIGGTAYVSSSSVSGSDAYADSTNHDVMTGEAIAVKSSQIAYLLPAECQGIPCNPMSYSQYEKMVANNANWKADALNSVLSSINKSLTSYGNVDVEVVFSASQGGSVYLYVSFDNVATASTYFNDLMNSSSATAERLQNYLTNYINAFTFNNDISRLVTDGNYLEGAEFNETTQKWERAQYTTSSSGTGTVTQELANYAGIYEALCTKLVKTKSALTSEEQGKTVFENLIQDTTITGFTNGSAYATASGVEITTQGTGAGQYLLATFSSGSGSTVNGIAVDNRGKDAYTVPAGITGIVLATGDVNVTSDFSGVIICDGQLKIQNNATLTADTEAVGTALRLSCQTTDAENNPAEFVFFNFFKGGENYALGDSETDNLNDVRNCIAYENWRAR